MSSTTAFEVPIQPYAGQLLIIKDLLKPKPTEAGTRTSYFDRCVIVKKLLKQLALVEGGKSDKISMFGYDDLVDGFLDALEAYMKVVVGKVIELCEHRCGYKLFMNNKFVLKSDVRTTMTFLNDLELADNGSSDDDEGFYRNMAELEDRRERKNRKERKDKVLMKEVKKEVKKEPKEEKVEKATNIRGIKASADNIAMMAFGSRKRPAAKASGTTTSTAAPNAAPAPSGNNAPTANAPRLKHVTIRDVLQVLEEDKRYCRSNMLYEAYLKYTT
ncbi:hypothetical protein KR038_011248 [Drosophila bunnanda]|nr:hypothetical protein KR038_006425 [Drosophila bunnanda]KAH8265062.1 hypothetical protein KR038_011248 [Drosophila bunnanda]